MENGTHSRWDIASQSAPATHIPDEPASPQPTSPNTDSPSPFLSHKVTKRDTLAGLAIRYNVTVSDIKRANGLLSDNALYARDTIQIPTGGLQPLGEEVQLLFAQIASGLGRDPVLNPEASLQPASAAAERVARLIANGEDMPYYPADDGSLPWWCRCGTCDEDENKTMCRDRRYPDSEEDEYELQERTGPDGVLLPPDAAGGPTRMAEQVRRRRQFSDAAGHESDHGGANGFSIQGEPFPPRHRPPRPRTMQPAHAGPSSGAALQGEGISNVMRQLADLGKSIGDLPLIQRIKAAANQPALAGPRKSQSFAAAAEAVLGTVKDKYQSFSRRSSPGSPDHPLLPPSYHADNSRRAVSQPRRREGDKTD